MNKAFVITLGILSTVLSFTDIKADGNTNVYIEKSLNGVEVINISTSSEKGISHSTFKEFNVSEKGAVINNAKNISRSNIAGFINGNKNIKDIRAKLALLDVTGEQESKLKGILEAISKDKLDVILSNPNGITLDGASFLNIHIEEAKRFFSKRVKPETIIKHKSGAITGVGYNGEVYTIRDYSKMGNNPVTIDINGSEFKNNKIKFLKK